MTEFEIIYTYIFECYADFLHPHTSGYAERPIFPAPQVLVLGRKFVSKYLLTYCRLVLSAACLLGTCWAARLGACAFFRLSLWLPCDRDARMLRVAPCFVSVSSKSKEGYTV